MKKRERENSQEKNATKPDDENTVGRKQWWKSVTKMAKRELQKITAKKTLFPRKENGDYKMGKNEK